MTVKTDEIVRYGVPKFNIFAGPFGGRIMHDKPDDQGAGNAGDDDPTKTKDKVDDQQDPPTGDKKPSDAEAALLKDVMKKKEALNTATQALEAANARLKEFEGIDPVAVRELLKQKRDAETAALEAKGDFDRVKQMMADEHAREKEALANQVKEKDDALSAAQRTINDLTVGASFAQSGFIAGELLIPATKARALYGDHFDVEDGRVVAYDKPKGAKTRTQLVDGSGEPLGFEAAIKKIVEADPDRDSLVKSKLPTGTGSSTIDAKVKDKTTVEVSGAARIALALEKRLKK